MPEPNYAYDNFGNLISVGSILHGIQNAGYGGGKKFMVRALVIGFTKKGNPRVRILEAPEHERMQGSEVVFVHKDKYILGL